MSVLSPRQAVYALARTSLDWVPDPPATLRADQAGFAAGTDARGRPLRWLTCPDCLTNGFTSTDCETCGGRGETPDTAARDPYEVGVEGPAAFFGRDRERQREQSRAQLAQILRLQQLANLRAGDPGALPEDWLSRALRLKDALHGRGDYRLLDQTHDLLAARYPARALAWRTFVVEQQPLRYQSAVTARLDESAAWIAAKMLSAIALTVAEQARRQELLGVRRVKTRPADIVVPVELVAEVAEAQAGKGRWANGGAQQQRNGLVAAMAHEGRTAGEIARRVGITKRRAQQLLAELQVQHQATGPAA